MLRTVILLVLKICGGLLIAGVIVAILIPLLPGLIEPWMVWVVALICIGGMFVATWRKNPMPPD